VSTPTTARRLSLWLPVGAWAAVIFALSSASELPAPPAELSDKAMHAGAYAVLAATIVRALAGGRWRGVTFGVAAAAVIAATLYGVTDEFHQSFVPGRSVDALDVLADFAGGTAAALTALALGWWRRRVGG
jgi:VanZ family protein